MFVRQDDRVGPPQYAVIAAKDTWQILLEYGDRYLRWVMRGAPGNEGPAWPDTDVAAHSLEREGGTLHKPALEREGNETYHDMSDVAKEFGSWFLETADAGHSSTWIGPRSAMFLHRVRSTGAYS